MISLFEEAASTVFVCISSTVLSYKCINTRLSHFYRLFPEQIIRGFYF